MTPTPDDWATCTCGHPAISHVRGAGRCRAKDADGKCDCPAVESGTSGDQDGEAPEEP